MTLATATATADVRMLLRSPRCVLVGHAPVYEQRHRFTFRADQWTYRGGGCHARCRRCGVGGGDLYAPSRADRLGRRWRELVRRVEAEREPPIDTDLPF